ncbi:MAG: SulP family inorganic anion transporter [Desulfobacteraceae bacterium]|nr:MAG: SulP family inorganic anion transporter [Desulfobacteraceae bacterium]
MLNRIFPFLSWFEGYDRNSLKADAVSGLTVALILIPQSLAVAQLAGLPAYYGLYASFLPPLVAALFGSSRQLSTGPVALVALLAATTLEPLAASGSEGYVAYTVLLTLSVGSLQFLLGVFRLGIIVNFLSHPVINGFTNAAALIIASSELPKMFGIQVDKAGRHYETILNVLKTAVDHTHWPTLAMGLFAFGLMYGMRRLSPKLPGVLIAVALTSLIAYATGFHRSQTVEISMIRSDEAAAELADYNRILKEIQRLSLDRAEAYAGLHEGKRGKDVLSMIDAEHRMKVLTVNILRLQSEAQRLRNRLRSFHFESVRTPDGPPMFVQKGQIPPGVEADGRTWRLVIGDLPFREPEAAKLVLRAGGDIVGHIPGGLPAFTLPDLDLRRVSQLLPFAAVISLFGFLEAVSIAKAIAAKTGQHLDPNQELIGQGLSNLLGSFFKSHPVSGSFVRSAVNLQSGAVSGMSSVFASITVVAVLLFFTPLLYYLPQSVLAAIIMLAALDLINVSGFVHAWRAQWYDGAISVIAFISTLLFAPHLERGIFIGTGLSLMVFLYKSMRPAVASLSLYEDETLHDHITYFLRECRFIEVVRFDGPLFFASAAYLEDQIAAHMQQKKELRHILISAVSINDLDATGEEALSLIIDRVRSAGIDISIAGANRNVLGVLKRTHLFAKIGEDHFYPTIEKAIKTIHRLTHNEKEEEACPLTTVSRIPQPKN